MTQKIKVGDYVKVGKESNYAYHGMLGKVLCVEKVYKDVTGYDVIVCEGFLGQGMFSFYFELVAPPKADKTFTLELTHEELVVMRVLAGAVLGSARSPRRHTDSVYYTMCEILGNSDPSEYVEYSLLNGRTIKFDDYPAVKTPQQLKIEELEVTIKEAQKKLGELKGCNE